MDPRTRIDRLKDSYWVPVILLTANHLGLFAALRERSLTPAELADELALDARAVDLVLLALAAEGLVRQKDDGRFTLDAEFAPYLAPDGDESLAAIMEHHYYLLGRWVQLTDVVRTGRPVPRTTGGRSPAQLEAFICGMRDISRRSTTAVAAAVDLSDCRRLLDVGGGPGTSSIVLCQHYPALHCTVFDLPEVIPIAQREIAAAGLTDRINTLPGDYQAAGQEGDFGSGFDCVYLSNIIHSLATAETQALLGKALAALAPGGRLVVKDFFLDDSRVEPAWGALFAVNMLIGTEGGKSYTWREVEAMLRDLGAVAIERGDLPPPSGLLLARKA